MYCRFRTNCFEMIESEVRNKLQLPLALTCSGGTTMNEYEKTLNEIKPPSESCRVHESIARGCL